MYREGRVAH